MAQRQGRLWQVFLVLLALGLGISIGAVLDRYILVAAAQSTDAAGAAPNFDLIKEAWNTMDRVYVDRSALDSTSLTYAAISGMVNALGDTGHSTFLAPQRVEQAHNFTQGQFEGIGAQVEQRDNHVVILAPFDDSPAQRAGLKPGDIIQKVNGQDMTRATVEEVVGKIIGKAGTSVTLTIVDPNTKTAREVTIVRERIVLQNVTWQRVPGTSIADLRIAAFSQNVTNDLKRALDEAKNQGVTAIVLDLRNDPGGLLEEAIGVTSQFLSQGDVLLEKNAQGQIKPLAVRGGGAAVNLPLVVLVNGGTASAAEIVAGAIQDAHRARLMGETTFGTGTVLNEFRLSDGSAIMLAVEEWLTPNGRVIWHRGIAPDVTVTQLPATTVVTPFRLQGMTAEQLAASGDLPLLEAIKALQ